MTDGYVCGTTYFVACLTNPIDFLDLATDTFDQGKKLDVTYLDFSKAFDKAHRRLVLQLKLYGIEGKILELIEAWLTGHQQRVILNGWRSNWKKYYQRGSSGIGFWPSAVHIYVNAIEMMWLAKC